MTASRDFITERLDPLTAAHSQGGSDYDLNPGARPAVGIRLKPAAVLVALVERPEGLSVLLTRRADSLRQHQGQVAFPGGRCDGEETPVEAAVREAEEEIGLDPGFVEPVGLLSAYETVTGYLVTPVVAFVRAGFSLTANPNEVAEVFETPFAWLMDGANYHQHFREPVNGGEKRYFYAMPFGDYYIWGATAGMLRGFFERLYGEARRGP